MECFLPISSELFVFSFAIYNNKIKTYKLIILPEVVLGINLGLSQ
jgi:hypothetical protein